MGAPKFFGRVVARNTSPLGASAIVEHDTARPLPAHDHRHAYFCLLARGGYEETAGRRLEYRPGGVVFHPTALHHRDAITVARTRLVIVEVDDAQVDQLRDLRATAARDVVRCDAPAGLLMAGIEARLATGPADGDDEDDGGALLFELLGVLAGARDERTPGPWLARAQELMAEEIGRPLRVGDIAARVGVHPVRLARAIRRRYRCSVSDHLHAIRLERACHLLRTTAIPLIEVAAMLGYADQSHFTRRFSTRVGLSPSRFRAATR